jgi:hypothetical protein
MKTRLLQLRPIAGETDGPMTTYPLGESGKIAVLRTATLPPKSDLDALALSLYAHSVNLVVLPPNYTLDVLEVIDDALTTTSEIFR